MRKPIAHGWHYKNIDQARSELLMREATIDLLVVDVLEGVVIEGIDLKEPCNEAKRAGVVASRISFRLRPVSEAASDALDRLLNGSYGLRARYCHSPEDGSNANSVVCRALAQTIRARSIGLHSSVPEQQLLLLSDVLGESFAKPSAKIWFDAPTDKRPTTVDDGEVFSDIWNQSRSDPKRVESALPELSPQQVQMSLSKGRSVPRPLAVDIKATFTEPNGVEYVTVGKRSRPLQLHLMGWT
jgi:hypothetical protein